MPFNFQRVSYAEFFVALEKSNQTEFRQIPIHPKVQGALIDILEKTKRSIGLPDQADTLPVFELSQKYSAEEQLRANLADPHFTEVQNLCSRVNIPTDASAIQQIDALSYYFVRFTDIAGKTLVAVRRANHFKGILKSCIITLLDDTLQLDERPLFKLDNDFDYLVLDQQIYILRPSGLEFTAAVGEHIRAAVANTVAQLRTIVPFIAFDGIENYVRGHRNGARLLASLRTRSDLASITKPKFIQQCRRCRLSLVSRLGGQVAPAPGHELKFLQVLDRRLYEVSLIPRKIEIYQAAHRSAAETAT